MLLESNYISPLLLEKRLLKNIVDVYDSHGLHFLINSKKVIITPHMAFYSRESLERIIEITLENINSYLLNKPVNLVKNE